MTNGPSEDDQRTVALKALMKALATDEVFSYHIDFEALANFIGSYYDAVLEPHDRETKEKFKKAFTDACLSYMRQRLSEKMIRGCGELVMESFTVALTFVLQSAGAPASLVNKTKVSTKLFEHFLAESRKGYIAPLKEHFLRDHHGSEATYDLTALTSHYQVQLPKWRLAKQDAKRDQNHPQHKHDWRDRLTTSYQLPEDLIEWLNQSEIERAEIMSNRTDFPHLQQKLENGYELNKPSEIALEHSARLCGAEPYFYSTAHLFDLVKKQR